jgi:ATP-dependent helicase HrpB
VQGKNRVQPLGALLVSRDLLTRTMCDAIEEALSMTSGDVLSFLPGFAEIQRVIFELQERRVTAEVLPLYGTLSKEKQDMVVFPAINAPRRVIVSSPLAEASLTLERVTSVVDSGLRREPRCDVDTGMPRLVTTRTSKAAAKQRAGRAGRVQKRNVLSGFIVRLSMTVSSRNILHLRLRKHVHLAPTVLLLADWGRPSRLEKF